jgi:DNA (cytosine-5)-methyltransferase 1
MRPIGVDLFAGAGGMSLGFEQAGFDIVAAVEIDPIHAAAHEFNFPHCAILPRSVEHLSGATIRDAANIGRRNVDIVCGGAPCQGFSLIGYRALDDPRNSLAREFVRIVGELGASYFVFENVKGLTLGRHRAFLVELIEAFDAIGYHVRLPWRVLDAAEFGVPQHRERLFLLGARKELPLPEYPAALCRAADDKLNTSLPLGPTCRDAIGDLPDPDGPCYWRESSAYARELRCIASDAWHYGHARAWNNAQPTAPKTQEHTSTQHNENASTQHTGISRRRFAATEPGRIEPISRFFKLDGAGLSNTLRAGTDAARGAFTSPRPIHYEQARCITVREMARLHGFPDWFRFHATKWHGARQIGNAVPPPLARAVAGAVMQSLGLEPARPASAIALGDPVLLGLDMSAAAAHFRVDKPIGRRNHKSGATKRRQSAIEDARTLALSQTSGETEPISLV